MIDTDRDAALRVAEGILWRQRQGPLGDHELAQYLVDSILRAAV